ncbi:QsdR family transcriptional regulator [Nocardia gipuzkoensis]|uniref:QsdR family transcriptional regulator n=1 Tax=Nocardia gipuzkoensis TaxID=2749991 RepID=UPI0015EF7699|nr:QsdR family transcriptional regulator [Nocardia gipuzkoensis]
MPVAKDDIVQRAVATMVAGQRLDLGTLAAELHISRATLFRRAGNRDQLLSEALWWLAERSLATSAGRWRQSWGDRVRDHDGGLRSVWIMTDHAARSGRDPSLQKLLAEEPVTAIRALTDPMGAMQPRMVAAVRQLLERDVDAAGLRPLVDLDTLAYGVVRLGESILYADIVAGRQASVSAASTLVAALVDGALQAS